MLHRVWRQNCCQRFSAPGIPLDEEERGLLWPLEQTFMGRQACRVLTHSGPSEPCRSGHLGLEKLKLVGGSQERRQREQAAGRAPVVPTAPSSEARLAISPQPSHDQPSFMRTCPGGRSRSTSRGAASPRIRSSVNGAFQSRHGLEFCTQTTDVPRNSPGMVDKHSGARSDRPHEPAVYSDVLAGDVACSAG